MNGVGQKKVPPSSPNTHLMLMTTCPFILLTISVKYEENFLIYITFFNILCTIFSKSCRPFFDLEVEAIFIYVDQKNRQKYGTARLENDDACMGNCSFRFHLKEFLGFFINFFQELIIRRSTLLFIISSINFNKIKA
jgi:hypothetical protein